MCSASADGDQPGRTSNQDNSFKTQQDEGIKLSHQINLLLYRNLHGLLCFWIVWGLDISFMVL